MEQNETTEEPKAAREADPEVSRRSLKAALEARMRNSDPAIRAQEAEARAARAEAALESAGNGEAARRVQELEKEVEQLIESRELLAAELAKAKAQFEALSAPQEEPSEG